MKAIRAGLFVIAVGCAAASLFPAAALAQTEKVLHAFASSGTDGLYPYAGLIEAKGVLYGTTEEGGNLENSIGSVFAVDPKTGAEKVVLSFCYHEDCADGGFPSAGVIDVSGRLYGTTQVGGAGGGGLVFSLNPKNGTEMFLYSFCGQQDCTDGEEPEAGLIDVNGTLYGTTSAGGSHGGGAVFSLDPKTGAETVVYSFCSQQNCADGEEPEAGLIDVNGTLYGTTDGGGADGGGAVFALDPDTGAESVLYSFCGRQDCTDGEEPQAALIDVSGTLYGTTVEGGSHGGGAAYSLDPDSGVETVLYSFCSQQECPDGQFPAAGLIDVKHTLYGTTFAGGSHGGGTVFALDPNTGAETVVYSFCGQQDCADGQSPAAGLIDVRGTLYGTTFDGGTDGVGTVFAVTP
jgi:uncharacterized repeat protein (TIGR03803 family)